MKYIPIYGHQQPTSQKQRAKIDLNQEEIDLFHRRHKDVRLGLLKNYQTYDLPMLNIPLPPPVKSLIVEPAPYPHSYLSIEVNVRSSYIPKIDREICSVNDITDMEYLEHHFKTEPWNSSTFCQASDFMLMNAYMRQRASMIRNPLDGETIERYARNYCVPIRNVIKFLLDEELRCMGYSPCSPTSMRTLPPEEFDWWLEQQSYQAHKYDSEPLFNYMTALHPPKDYK